MRRELRAIRRRAAILGVLAELGEVHSDAIARVLGLSHIAVTNVLIRLERDGSVVHSVGSDVASALWLLRADAERIVPSGYRSADDTDEDYEDWVRETLHSIFGDEP